MADSMDTAGAPRRLLVDGRAPFADEAISTSADGIISVAAPDANGDVFVSAVADGFVTITVAPSAEDVNRSAGSDDITVATFVTPTPLAVTLE